MNTKKFIIGTLTGGIAFFVLGFLIYGLALEAFFMSHAGSAIGTMKTMEEMAWWPLLLGNLASGALLSYIYLKWAGISTFGAGFRAGAIIGFFVSLSYNMISFATSNTLDLTGAWTDVAVGSLMTALGGGCVGLSLGIGNKH